MDIITVALLILLLIFIIVIIFWLLKIQKQFETLSSGPQGEGPADRTLVDVIHRDMMGLQTDVKDLRDNVEEKMSQSQRVLHEKLEASSKVLGGVREELGKVHEAQSQIKGLDEAVKGIEKIFASPKLRGIAGEFTLESILQDSLPGQYESQHYFKDHSVVDFIVKIRNKYVPIDSKFPSDLYRVYIDADEANRSETRKTLNVAIENNIKSIAEKYIRPDEDTMDFALMYVPSNKMFYDIFLEGEAAKDSSVERMLKTSYDKKVFPVCPAILYIYLRAIGLGLKGLKIEESAQEIIRRLENIRKKFEKFKNEYDKVEKGMQKVQKDYDDSRDKFRKFDDEMERILKLKIEEEIEEEDVEWQQ